MNFYIKLRKSHMNMDLIRLNMVIEPHFGQELINSGFHSMNQNVLT